MTQVQVPDWLELLIKFKWEFYDDERNMWGRLCAERKHGVNKMTNDLLST
ncbi:hypothetical protein HZS_2631 [Henneguya salminicola]|nr:hypothetical protein HZS_2631 [Henneguya salminicola]